jgi:hypothetical protein
MEQTSALLTHYKQVLNRNFKRLDQTGHACPIYDLGTSRSAFLMRIRASSGNTQRLSVSSGLSEGIERQPLRNMSICFLIILHGGHINRCMVMLALSQNDNGLSNSSETSRENSLQFSIQRVITYCSC